MGAAKTRAPETGFNKFINEDEVQLLDEWIAGKGDNYKLVYYLMKYCGLRISDATRVHETWIQGELLIFTMTKGKRTHVAYLPLKLRVWINDYYIPTHKDKFKDGYLAYNNPKYASNGQKNKYLQPGTIRATFCEFRQYCDLRDIYHRGRDGRDYHRVTPHTLRHLFAETAYAKTGHDARTVQDLLGHKKTETTFKFYLRGVKSNAHRAQIGELIADTI